jgi:hypothetical protein
VKTPNDKPSTISTRVSASACPAIDRAYLGLRGFNEPWLRECWDRWTNSYVQTKAWSYRGDFGGFVRWFLTA